MPTCAKCSKEISGSENLECPDCEQGYCRDHYHGHICETEKESTQEITKKQPDKDSSSTVSSIGYGISGIAGSLGLIYLAGNVDVILVGGSGQQVLQALVSLVVAGSLFSFATFVLVGSYVFDQS